MLIALFILICLNQPTTLVFGITNKLVFALTDDSLSVNLRIENTSENGNDNLVSLTLEFEKFTPEEVARFAAYYRKFKGFKSEQVLNQSSTLTKLVYNSNASKDAIISNLRKTAEINGFNVLVRSANHNVHIRLLSKTANSLDYREW